MADMIATGSEWLAQQQAAHLSRSITYRRGGASVDLVAMVGRWEYEEAAFDGGIVRMECRDYLIAASDLILADAVTLPASGDVIEEVAGGVRYSYEVMAISGEGPYRYENNRATLRIHVKEDGSEAVT